MNALHPLFTGLLYLVILLHPRGTVYCFRPRSTSIGTRKKTPPQYSSSSSTPPSSPSPSSSTANAIKAPFSSTGKRRLFSKHMKNNAHGPVSLPTQSPHHHHIPPSFQSHPGRLPAENMCNHCSITHWHQTDEVPHERTSYQLSQENCPYSNVLLELDQGDFAGGVVQKMFQKGWTQVGIAPPTVRKILKINHISDALNAFESYRRTLQARASTAVGDDGRLSFDGNELLRYWCSDLPDTPAHLPTIPKEILLSKSSRRAHEKMHEDGVEGDSTTRAMFVCRVIAGRIARQRRGGGLVELEAGQFDSLAVGQDLLVLDPRALLPCFIVVFEDDPEEEDGNSSSPDWSTRSGAPTCSWKWYMRPIIK